MFQRFSNWRTTLLGVAAIVAAISDVATQIAQSDWDATRFGADVTGVFTGLGLLFARDAVASERDHLEDRVRISQVHEAVAETAAVAVANTEAIKEVAAVAAPEVVVP